MGERGVQLHELGKALGRRFHQRFVVNQTQRFHRDGVTVGLAIPQRRLPGEVVKRVAEAVAGSDRFEQAALCPLTHAVMGPDDDIRPLAAACRLLETVGQVVGKHDFHFDAGIFQELVSDSADALLTFIVAHPDGQAVILKGEGGECGGGR